MTGKVVRRENLELLALLKNETKATIPYLTALRGKDDWGTRRMLRRLKGMGLVEEQILTPKCGYLNTNEGECKYHYRLTTKGEALLAQ